MKKYFIDIWGDFTGLSWLLIVGLLIVSLTLLVNYGYERSCSNYSEMTGKETKWLFLDACYVNTESGWIRYDERIRKNFEGEL